MQTSTFQFVWWSLILAVVTTVLTSQYGEFICLINRKRVLCNKILTSFPVAKSEQPWFLYSREREAFP